MLLYSFVFLEEEEEEVVPHHLSVCLGVSVKAVYNELHDALMAVSDQEDLRWWKNTHGPGMPTDWPQFQVPNR